MKYGFIGAGNMAQAMIKGLIKNGVATHDIIVSSPSSAAKLSNDLDIVAADLTTTIQQSDLVVLAFLPKQLATILADHVAHFKDKLTISVLAGVTLTQLHQVLPDAQLVRSLPNVNSTINQGCTAIAFSHNVTVDNQQKTTQFYTKLGTVNVLPEEQFLTFSAIAGSGPAYVFNFIDALIAAGMANGLDAQTAQNITIQTLLGSSQMLQQSQRSPQEWMNIVASPGGSTRAGLDSLTAQHFNNVIKQAIDITVNHKHA